jgi:hypothetical protein
MRYKNLATALAILVMAGAAFGYTSLTRPTYIDWTLVGGSSYVTGPSNVYDYNSGSGVYIDTVHMDAHLQGDTLTISADIYDPIVVPLDGTVTLRLGIPRPSGQSAMLYVAPGDSYAVALSGKWRKFYIYKSGATDSTTATGYMLIGRAGPNVQNMHLR